MLRMNGRAVRSLIWSVAVFLVAGALSGCQTTWSTSAGGTMSDALTAVKEHGHSPWRYKTRHGGRSMTPRGSGQEPLVACRDCDGPDTKGTVQ